MKNMSCDIDSDSFHTKKGGQRKYVRKAYEKSKQLSYPIRRSAKQPMKRINVKRLVEMLQMVKRDENLNNFTLDETIRQLIRISK